MIVERPPARHDHLVAQPHAGDVPLKVTALNDQRAGRQNGLARARLRDDLRDHRLFEREHVNVAAWTGNAACGVSLLSISTTEA